MILHHRPVDERIWSSFGDCHLCYGRQRLMDWSAEIEEAIAVGLWGNELEARLAKGGLLVVESCVQMSYSEWCAGIANCSPPPSHPLALRRLPRNSRPLSMARHSCLSFVYCSSSALSPTSADFQAWSLTDWKRSSP